MQTDHKKIIAEIVKDIRFSMLTFTADNGHLHACPMTAQEQETNGEIWFLGSKSSELVASVRTRPQVNVAFSKPSDQDFVSFNGQLELVTNEAKVDALWSDLYKIYYPAGRSDPDIQLLCFKPHGAHYWKGGGKMATLFKMTKAAVTGDAPESLGESHSVNYT